MPSKEPKKNKALRALLMLLLAASVLAAGVAARWRTIGKLFYPQEYAPQVEKWAAEYGVDPCLVYAVIKTESSFNPKAESSANARGLMQLTEDTFDWIKMQIDPYGAQTYDDMYTPDENIRFGTYFLSRSLEKYGGDVPTAAAAYHSGWGAVDALLQQGENTPDGVRLAAFPEPVMAHYVDKITRSYTSYRSLYTEDGENIFTFLQSLQIKFMID